MFESKALPKILSLTNNFNSTYFYMINYLFNLESYFLYECLKNVLQYTMLSQDIINRNPYNFHTFEYILYLFN